MPRLLHPPDKPMYLTHREWEIIKLRYGIDYESTYTLEEVGRIFKVTRERVRQIEAKAVKKIKSAGGLTSVSPAPPA